MLNKLKKLFYNRAFTNLKLITLKKSINKNSLLKELFYFFTLKIILVIYNITQKKIYITKITLFENINILYRILYKIILLILINIFTLWVKNEKKLSFIFYAVIIALSSFLLIRHYIHLISPELLHAYLIPNTSQILIHLTGNFSETTIVIKIEQILLEYIFPFGGCLLLSILYWLNFDLSEQQQPDDSFSEMVLLMLLQTYSTNFIEDTQEELLNTYIPLTQEYSDIWDDTFFKFFGIFFLCTQQIWSIDLYNYWPFFRKRDNDVFEDAKILHYIAAEYNSDNKTYYKQHFYTLVSYRDKHYGEDFLFNFTDVYNDYIKVILFKLQPLLEQSNIIMYLLFFTFLFFFVIELIITAYMKNITSIYFEQLTYTLYRPFLDQYFYSWYRLLINISQIKNQNFLIKSPYQSQYLDLFKFIPNTEDFQVSIFEKLFHTEFTYFPTTDKITEILDNDDDDSESEIEQLNILGTKEMQGGSIFYCIVISVFFFEVFRKNPLLISGRINDNLALFTPLSNIQNYSWLFQNIQNSSIFSYLNWPGWLYVLPKLILNQFYTLEVFNLIKAKILSQKVTNKYTKFYWWKNFLLVLPQEITRIKLSPWIIFDRLKIAKNNITSVFFQQILGFSYKPKTKTLLAIKFNISLKQKRNFLQRKMFSFFNKKK